MRLLIAVAALTATALAGQDFDPVRSATGWARMDKDGSITFYDAGTLTLRTWSRDGGEMGKVSLGRLEATPEKWVLDIYGNAWIVAGGTLYLAEAKTGKVSSKEKLPAEVSDLAWDVKGFVIGYRGQEPYVEKRDYRNGSVTWSYGSKPKRGAVGGPTRVAVTDEGQVLLASGPGLPLTLLEGAKGKALGQTAFTFNGLAAPDLIMGGTDRGPLVIWNGKAVAFAAINGRQVPEAKMSGALVARLDMSQSTVEFLPTGLTEDHQLIGVHEGQAVYIKPTGGLTYVQVR
ncbi:MAG: hypothetical protein IPL96_12560 [Holophagaceae bacterium]|nr:hypothetical protein [Holophagaceae bacterium]